jgi:hypothetical protein
MSVSGASAGASYSDSIARKLPSDVKKELDNVFSPAWDRQVVMVIGPEFKSGTPKEVIIENFLTGLNTLVRHGQLSQDSAFVKAAIAALSDYLTSDNGERTVLDKQRLDFVSIARAGLERVIAQALLASASL